MTLNDISKAINEEMEQAEIKFPSWPEDLIHGAAIVVEEAGELIKACLQNRYEKGSLAEVEKEAIQTATMAIRFLENLPMIMVPHDPI
jgi:hypothetical protein